MTSEVGPRPDRSVVQILEAEKDKGWHMNPSLVRLYALLVPACLMICVTNGYDSSLLNGLQSVPKWEEYFDHPTGAILGFMSASYPLGAILSTPFSALISDRYGRRWSIFIGSLIMIAGVAIQTASNSLAPFIVSRIVVGFGITLALTAGPVLISELVHPSHRVFVTALYATTFYVGSLICAWSPRWLINKGREEEPFNILATYHANGNTEDELVLAEYHEIRSVLATERTMEGNGVKLFFATSGNRRRLLILIILAVAGQWSGNGLVSYYLSKILSTIGITEPREQLKINGAITCTNYATSVLAAVCAARLGRRWLFVGGGVGMWATFSALTIGIAVYNELSLDGAGKAALAFIFIYYSTFNFALNPTLYLYPSEILPFSLRATGMSVLIFTNKAALFFNQFVNPIGMDDIGWKYYLVYVAWLAVEVGLFWAFFPETYGLTLEAIGEVFDGVSHGRILEEGKGSGEDGVTVHKESV
ncbi:major facilitator superfamily domain-containing protein [Aspergillus stella-maris]|uniref:major facilitator superfamily domain-containing protein n=1 Tax=Aspergillus stella-maris TaxID=1810926 RepID=UPI003CCCB747